MPGPTGPNPMRYAAFGSEFAGAVLLPLLLGLFADHQLDSAPVGLIAGVLIGLLLAGLLLARLVYRIRQEQNPPAPPTDAADHPDR